MDADRNTVADIAAKLHADAYPDKDAAWIADKVATANERIEQARQARSSTSPNARRLTDAVINRAAPRRHRAARRVLLGAGLAAVAAVAVVLGVTERQWVAEAAISAVGIVGLLAAAAVAATGTVVSYVRSRRERVLSCRVRIDAPFGVDLGETVRLEGERHAVTEPGVVVVRIKSAGGAAIDPEDYVSPLSLRFPGRTVVSVDATEFEPAELQRVLTRLPDFAIDGDRVRLPGIGLKPEHSFKLVIVLSGTKPGVRQEVVVEGGLRDGRITTREGQEKIRPATLVFGGLTAICAGAFAVVLLLNNVTPFAPLPEGVACAPGRLVVEGSTAFGHAAAEMSGSYRAYCPDASIKISTPGSKEGLRRLNNPRDGAQHVALSDGRFDRGGELAEFKDLRYQPLAVVPYTFVASDNVPVDTLSTAQARQIFTGQARVWSDITKNPRDTAEIRVVGRSTDSGTRRTLEQYVLGTRAAPVLQADATSDSCRDRLPGVAPQAAIVCEQGSTGDLIDRVANLDDAIGYAGVPDADQVAGVKEIKLNGLAATFENIRDHDYPFWTVEYLASKEWPEPGSLPDAFKNFILSPEGRTTMAGFQFYACMSDARPLCTRR